MKSYQDFLKAKKLKTLPSGIDVADSNINSKLFDFQKQIVKWALHQGRAAIFADTGLGKTAMQLEWAKHILDFTKTKVLILAPLAVAKQTEWEGHAFGIKVKRIQEQSEVDGRGIYVTNYDRLDKFSLENWGGIVLDESSILKHHTSKTRTALIDAAQSIPYRLACTATPSPNDFMELGNHAEFLGAMSRTEMLAQFFTHDGGETSKWRLKGHGANLFWEWMASWAVCIRTPKDLGFDDSAYHLPALNIIEHTVKSPPAEGELFPSIATDLSSRLRAKRESVNERCEKALSIIASSPNEPWIVWCHRNDESELLEDLLGPKYGAFAITGSDTIDVKEYRLEMFADETLSILITKPSIAGFGLNWQHCSKMLFVGMNDSFEEFYQSVRRCYRFGQKKPVDVHVIVSESEGSILKNIKEKERKHKEMQDQMANTMMTVTKSLDRIRTAPERSTTGKDWQLYNGDCVKMLEYIPPNSIDYSVFSPPFSSLYVYSDLEADMGNSRNDAEFFAHFEFLAAQLFRVIKDGRLVSFHCMNLPTSKERDGNIGLKDFRGDMIRIFQKAGFIYHSEVCIWKDPVTAMQRTKAIGLLWKQLKKDSTISRMGIPDYVVTMRKPGVNQDPISHTPEQFPVAEWQKVASPIWDDIDMSDTLNYRAARENEDERHICPLQLPVIERCLKLWSRKGDLVLSPFAGVGSEGYQAVKMGRKFVGIELKPSYYDLAIKNIKEAETANIDLFTQIESG